MTCGIYLITCKITCRGYVGQSINIERRWKQHHKRFNPAYFKYEILEVCAPDELCAREKFHVQDQNTVRPYGFNGTIGGNGLHGIIPTFTPAHRANLSASLKATWARSPDRKSWNAGQLGVQSHTPETRKAIADKMRLLKADPVEREAISNRLRVAWAKRKLKANGGK